MPTGRAVAAAMWHRASPGVTGTMSPGHAAIDGVIVRETHDLVDERGALQHMVRADDLELFSGFGEIYFSMTNPGIVKGWHRQQVQTNLLSCICGRLRLVLYDDRDASLTRGTLQIIECGDGARKVIRVPPQVIYGWQNIGAVPAILANCASHPHDAAHSERFDLDAGRVPYVW